MIISNKIQIKPLLHHYLPIAQLELHSIVQFSQQPIIRSASLYDISRSISRQCKLFTARGPRRQLNLKSSAFIIFHVTNRAGFGCIRANILFCWCKGLESHSHTAPTSAQVTLRDRPVLFRNIRCYLKGCGNLDGAFSVVKNRSPRRLIV